MSRSRAECWISLKIALTGLFCGGRLKDIFSLLWTVFLPLMNHDQRTANKQFWELWTMQRARSLKQRGKEPIYQKEPVSVSWKEPSTYISSRFNGQRTRGFWKFCSATKHCFTRLCVRCWKMTLVWRWCGVVDSYIRGATGENDVGGERERDCMRNDVSVMSWRERGKLIDWATHAYTYTNTHTTTHTHIHTYTHT